MELAPVERIVHAEIAANVDTILLLRKFMKFHSLDELLQIFSILLKLNVKNAFLLESILFSSQRYIKFKLK